MPAPRLSPDVVARRLGDEVVLVHLGTNRIYSLNATAGRYWELVHEGLDEAEVARRMQHEFDVGAGELQREIDAMRLRLAAEGLVVGE